MNKILNKPSLSDETLDFICRQKGQSEEFVAKQGDLNFAVADLVFSYLNQQGITATNVTVTYGYFLFCFYPNSVYHFNVKGLSKKWKFGMWIQDVELCELPDNSTDFVQVFCQHEDEIDKFKPSKSYMRASLSYKDFASALEGNVNDNMYVFGMDMRNIVKFIKLHPLIARTCYAGCKFLNYRPTLSLARDAFNSFARKAKHRLSTEYVKRRSRKIAAYDVVDNLVVHVLPTASDSGTEYRQYTCTLKEEANDDDVYNLMRKVFPYKSPSALDGDYSFEVRTIDGRTYNY